MEDDTFFGASPVRRHTTDARGNTPPRPVPATWCGGPVDELGAPMAARMSGRYFGRIEANRLAEEWSKERAAEPGG